MDLSELTIPPELFYSKTLTNAWKPKAFPRITPTEITKALKKSRNVTQRRKNTRKARAPILGRIGNIKPIKKKKFVKKKSHIQAKSDEILDKENVNKTVSINRTSVQNERTLLKEIKEKEEVLRKRMFSSNSVKRKRSKGSSFKFFKSKNDRESSSESDDLLSDIQDYSDDSFVTSNTSSGAVQSSISILPDEAPFEGDEDEELDGTVKAIESLLKGLDTADNETANDKVTATKNDYESPSLTQDGLIDTPGGETPEISKKVEIKKKFMGFGSNQLQIDAGQKKFGLVECKDCGFSYNVSFICCFVFIV